MKTKISSRKILSEDNAEIYYWINCKKDHAKKKFAFLHPASSMNHTALEPLEKMLEKEGFSIIAIDPRGTGYSQTPNKKEYFSLNKYTSDIEQIIKIEGIEKPYLIGHSMGFMPIINYVAETNNAEKIFGIGGSYYFPETTANSTLFHIFNKALRYNEILGSAAIGIWHKIHNESRPYNDQSKIYNGKNAYIAFVDVSLKESLNHCISGIEINKWNITEQLKNIRPDIILIYGKKDVAVVPEKAGNKILTLNRNAKMYIIDGGHDVPLKNPEKIIEIIKNN